MLLNWLKQKLDSGQRKRLHKAVFKRLWEAQVTYVGENNIKIAYKSGYEDALKQVLELLEEYKR